MEVDKEQQEVMRLMTAYGCSAEKAREFIVHTDAFNRAIKHADAGLITQEQAAAELGVGVEDLEHAIEMQRVEVDGHLGFVVSNHPGDQGNRRFFTVDESAKLKKRIAGKSPAFGAPYGVGPVVEMDYEEATHTIMHPSNIGKSVIYHTGRWSGRVLPPEAEVTSEQVKVASLIEFAGTKQGRQEIEAELGRRAAEDNSKIRSAEAGEGTRKQRREMARRMNKAIRKAKSAGVKR